MTSAEIADALEAAAKIEDLIARADLLELRKTIEDAGGIWQEPPSATCVNAELLRQAAGRLREMADVQRTVREALDDIESRFDNIVSEVERQQRNGYEDPYLERLARSATTGRRTAADALEQLGMQSMHSTARAALQKEQS